MLGERVLNRFILEERLGSGAYGTVYRAWDERLQRPVAVKVIDNPAPGDRILREAQAAARLAHPGIVTLYELARSYERAYLVTELVEGATLRSLGRDGRLSDAAVASIGADCADALSHAHEHGVIHRDIKPENILVADKDASAKLVDFGIARIVGADTLTANGDVLGTLAYMAPEQAEGYRPGPHADVYSLALTLFEGWTGNQPLLRHSAAATARAIGEPMPLLADARPDLPQPLTAVIDAALDAEPGNRPEASDLCGICTEAAPRLDTDSLAPSRSGGDAPEHPGLRIPRRVPVIPLLLVCLCTAVIAWAGAGADPWILTATAGAAILSIARPRLALALASASLSIWLAAAASQPAAAGALGALAAIAITRSGADLYAGREQASPF